MLDEARRVAADIGGLLGVGVDAATVLAGRAAIMNLGPPGRISAGGATRLLPTADGWCAVSLPRDDDLAALPALMQTDALTGDPWRELSAWAATRSGDDVIARTQLLDIAAATLGEASAGLPTVRACGAGAGPRRADGLLVVDMSSLWAGPLCGQLLARAGAVVVKVESPGRPDGTRRGEPAFFDWMNNGKLSYAIDFDAGADALRRLLSVADIVIEGSRPGSAATPAAQRRPTCPGGRAEYGCASTVIEISRIGRRSATTPRSPAVWSTPTPTDRCSAATPSPTRSAGWRPHAR